jgi:hypothetical protein
MAAFEGLPAGLPEGEAIGALDVAAALLAAAGGSGDTASAA